MGYDFTFFSFSPDSGRKFPCGFADAPRDPVPLRWPALRQRILARGARKNGGVDSLWLDTPGEGSIGFFGSENSVALDVHCNWSEVLALYLDLRTDEPDLVIFDDQEGCFFDEASFRQFMTDQGYPPKP